MNKEVEFTAIGQWYNMRSVPKDGTAVVLLDFDNDCTRGYYCDGGFQTYSGSFEAITKFKGWLASPNPNDIES